MRTNILLIIPILFSIISINSLYADKNSAQEVLKETENSKRWVYIGKTKDGLVGFMDTDRFAKSGSKRNVWTKVIYTGEEAVYRENNGQKYQVVSSITNRMYECSSQKVSDIRSIDYDTDGNSYTTDFKKLYRAYPEKRWITIIPGTLGEYLLNFVCDYKKQTQNN